MLRFAQTLDSQLRSAMERAFPEAATEAIAAGQPLDPQLAPASKPEFGDFQANGALALAKPLKQAPRQIAAALVEELEADETFGALCLAPEIPAPASSTSPCGPKCWRPRCVSGWGIPGWGCPWRPKAVLASRRR